MMVVLTHHHQVHSRWNIPSNFRRCTSSVAIDERYWSQRRQINSRFDPVPPRHTIRLPSAAAVVLTPLYYSTIKRRRSRFKIPPSLLRKSCREVFFDTARRYRRPICNERIQAPIRILHSLAYRRQTVSLQLQFLFGATNVLNSFFPADLFIANPASSRATRLRRVAAPVCRLRFDVDAHCARRGQYMAAVTKT